MVFLYGSNGEVSMIYPEKSIAVLHSLDPATPPLRKGGIASPLF